MCEGQQLDRDPLNNGFSRLKGEPDGSDYKLTSIDTKKRLRPDDVKIDQFSGCQLLIPTDVPISSRRVLAGVYKRADKELAHLTNTFEPEFNTEPVLIEAATVIETLLKEFLYDKLKKPMPQMNP